METIAVRIERDRGTDAPRFEAFLEAAVARARDGAHLLAETTLSVFVNTPAATEAIVMARFPAEELQRVTRANWPFVLRALFEILAASVAAGHRVAGTTTGTERVAEELLAEWNRRFGQFTQLSLERVRPVPE
jgi:hypothetical protein